MDAVNEAVTQVGYRRISGYERVGSVGDLHVRFVTAMTRRGRRRIWVFGCFDNPNLPLQSRIDEGSYRSELFALVWRMVRSDVTAILARATVFPRTLFRRIVQRGHQTGKPGI